LSSKNKKYKQVKINFYPEQYQILLTEAKKNDSTIAQYIRQKLNLNLSEKDTKKRYAKSDEKDCHKKTDPKLIYELSKIGTNLNQITYKINKKEYVPNAEVIENLDEIKKIYKVLETLI